MAETVLKPTRTGVHTQPDFDLGRIQRDLTIRRVGGLAYVVNALVSYFFLWAPIVVLVVFSFNSSRSVARWEGFTLQWYANIFSNVSGQTSRAATTGALDALGNSMIIGIISTVIATILATALALALVRYKFPGKQFIDGLLYLPVVIPEIAQAVSLVLFFRVILDMFAALSGGGPAPFNYGFGTIIVGHVVFNIAFVVVVVRARLSDMNPRLEEAARDLGANEWQTFSRITLPLLMPAIIAGGLLAFTLSLDDYLITAFLAGPGTNTLTVFVFGLMRRGISPEINAISTLMIVLSIVLIGISLLLQGRSAASSSA
jgi:spermidine/putrescine transport system permease protein